MKSWESSRIRAETSMVNAPSDTRSNPSAAGPGCSPPARPDFPGNGNPQGAQFRMEDASWLSNSSWVTGNTPFTKKARHPLPGFPFCCGDLSLGQFFAGIVQSSPEDLVHVVIPVAAQTPAKQHIRPAFGQLLILVKQLLVFLYVYLFPGCHWAGYSRVMTVFGWVPKLKCLCSMMRV